MKATTNQSNVKQTKRHFRASGSILLPLAQKCRFSLAAICGTFVALMLPGLTVSSVSAAPASLTLEVPSTPLPVQVQPDSVGKTAAATLKVSGNAVWGYTLTLSGTSDLKNGSNILPSLKTEVAEVSGLAVNTWGYKFTGGTIDATKFHAGPSSSATTLDNNSTALSSGTPKTYTVTLGAKVDGTQPAGKYSGNFTFTVTAKAVSYAITYDTKDGTGGPANQTGSSTDNTLTLTNSQPTKDGFEFKGWCNVTTSDENCTGNTYQPGGSYPLTNSNNTATLYAMWQSTGPKDLGNLGDMQTFTCSKIAKTEDYGTVTDTRDNNTYKVAKLKDGNCWMIDNLKLGSGLSTGSTKALTSADSDVPAGGFTMTMTAEKASYTGSGAARYDMDAAYIDSTYGGYYSWHTATAGTGTYEMSTSKQNATNSICPKGWRLPTGGTKGEFQALATAYGDTGLAGTQALQATPVPGFTLGGYIYNSGGGFTSKGSYGYYWSSTVGGANVAYYLYFDSSDVHPATNSYKYFGLSVRCVSRQ